MFGGAFQAATQPCREKIDRFPRRVGLDLNADGPAVDIEVGLRDDGPLHRRIAMPGQSHTGVQHRSACVPRELTDLAARVFGRRRKLVTRGDLDVDILWRCCPVAHS